MERKIGEIFEYHNEWYQCIPDTTDDNCNNCFFKKSCSVIAGYCSSTSRSDGKSVAFKKLEKVGEPFSCNYYGDARLVMMQEYQLFDSNVTYCYQTRPMYITDYKHKRIAIEIKQNEDMEEKKIQHYDCFFDKKEKDKLNLKPFDLNAAKLGKPVCTRDGRKARIICWDKIGNFPIVALVMGENNKEYVFYYNGNGRDNDAIEKDYDLMMLPEKKEGWVNVYKGGLLDTKSYPTKKEAFDKACPEGYLDTVKVCWEE